MGYYTYHKLVVRKINNTEQFDSLEAELKDRQLIGYAFDDGEYKDNWHEAYFYPYDAVKWYDHAKDMCMIAEKYPNMYFMLEGDGEESGDYWREYYHDMDVEACRGEVIYEEPKKIQWKELIRF